jgi:uncharacterized protein
MRRKEKEITSRKEIDAVIRNCRFCHLAFAVNHAPYLVPLCFGYDGIYLYIHTAGEGQKIDYIRNNPQVCFAMESDVRLVNSAINPCRWTFAFESVIGHGRIEELIEPDDKVSALGCIIRQYAEGYSPPEALAPSDLRVWRIGIESITGKRSNPPG